MELFIADDKPVRSFIATPENISRVVKFIRNFPLSTSWAMSDREIMEFILSPSNIFVENDNALVSFEDVVPKQNASIGFAFWDKKVSGNEKFLREVFMHMISILKLRRFTCYVPEKNRVMWRMLERIGFHREGRMRDAMVLPDGSYTSILLYGILYEELHPSEGRVAS